ncbi:MAG: HNH endonuclease family protein, partial [Candidatus Poribacteria bacterium]|nr:HNH endonuclease family protein [Candidatus Poribacteria bacterium]
YHFIGFEKWYKREYQAPVEMIKQNVNILIYENTGAEAVRFIDQYSRELKESFEITKMLFTSREPYMLDIFALSRLATFYPLLIKTYKWDKSNAKDDFKRVAQLVEIISFRFGITKSRSDKGVRRLYWLAREFKGGFDQLIRDLQNFVEKYCNNSDFERDLCQPRFHEVVDGGDQRYLLWKYENHLRTAEIPISPEMSYETFMNAAPQTKFTIEHIIPQNVRDSKKVTVDDSILSITDFEENYLHSIGNLVLDSRSANASKSDRDFATKDEQYSKAPLKSQLELGTFGNPKPARWNHISISNRTDKIVKFALERWNTRNV